MTTDQINKSTGVKEDVIAKLTDWQNDEHRHRAEIATKNYCERMPGVFGGPKMEFDPASEDGKYMVGVIGDLLKQVEEIRDGKKVDTYPRVSAGRYYCSFHECIGAGEVPCPKCLEWSCKGHFYYDRGLCLPCKEKEDAK